MRYFDYNATAPLASEAREAWLHVQEHFWANPSSPTRAAARARNLLEEQRAQLAACFGLPPERVVFTSGATEGNNAVLRWIAESAAPSAPVAISAIEHPSVRDAARRSFPGRVTRLPVNASGVLELGALERVLAEEAPALVSVLAASNETGVRQPWREVAARCRAAGRPFHCDAVQWIGKLPLEGFEAVDFVTGSGHKFGGPKGVGFILLGPGQAGFRGAVGGGQENEHRAGTEDLAGIAAMVAALTARLARPPPNTTGRDCLVAALRGRGASLLGEVADRLPHTATLLMPRYDRTRWISRLDRLGFAVASGSACATGQEGPSAVLQAMGVPDEAALRSVRVSGGPDTSLADWEALADAFGAAQAALDADQDQHRLTTVIDL